MLQSMHRKADGIITGTGTGIATMTVETSRMPIAQARELLPHSIVPKRSKLAGANIMPDAIRDGTDITTMAMTINPFLMIV